MASKSTFLALGVILAVFMLISSEVAARELAEDTKKEKTKVETRGGNQHRGGGGYTGPSETLYCLHSCCSEGPGGCRRCCSGGGVVQSQPHN